MTQGMNVAMIGAGFMGKAYAMAYAAMPMFFWPASAIPHRKGVVGVTDGAAETARQRFGFDTASSDWRAVVARPDIDVVDICTPNNVHAKIAIAAAKAGKHIICQKAPCADGPESPCHGCCGETGRGDPHVGLRLSPHTCGRFGQEIHR